ncbi:MAG: F0F1 ATP synthase subunit A [Candidatus Gracilibacteria bacterium]|nr:F0F1 ATP synthase subunit A [Candidatus Gracilibacteria bacterium]
MSFLIPTAFAKSAETAGEHIGPHIPSLAGSETGFELLGISITTTVFSTWLFMICLFIGVSVLYRASKGNNSPKTKAVGIDLVQRLDVFFFELLGNGLMARRYLWLVAGVFVFIFLANIFGLILDVINLIVPAGHSYLRPINSDLNTTLVLSTTIILVAQATGVWGRGFWKHYGHYLFNFEGHSTAEKFISVFIGWLHLFGEFLRVGSLSLRLFLNIFVGIILISVVVYIGQIMPGYGIGEILTLPFWFFELLVAFLQAYIFMTLSGLYLKESLHTHHHEHQS